MASFNKITIVGYLGRDPEIRYTAQGTAICDFSIATTERKKDKSGNMQDHTTWFRVTTFGRQAELANQYLGKGKQIYIEGQLSLREWTDKDGHTRASLEVKASDLQFIAPPAQQGQQGQQPTTAKAAAAAATPQTLTDEVESILNGGSAANPTPTTPPVLPTHIADDDIPF